MPEKSTVLENFDEGCCAVMSFTVKTILNENDVYNQPTNQLFLCDPPNYIDHHDGLLFQASFSSCQLCKLETARYG